MPDSAALHPELSMGLSNYYRECSELRERIKYALKDSLNIGHKIYIVGNTTHALLTIIVGLTSNGGGLNVKSSIYPPYLEIQHSDDCKRDRSVDLITHVDPMTGNVSLVDDYPSSGLIVIDAAHSFGTVRWHREALKAGIFIAPLHKHCGVIAGLGLIALHPLLEGSPIHRAAIVAEAGTQSLSVLTEAVSRLDELGQNLVNRLVLNLSEDFIREARALGVEILTPPNSSLPFICVRGIGLAAAHSAASELGMTVKHFSDHNITRISGVVRGSMLSSALDLGNALENIILRLLRR